MCTKLRNLVFNLKVRKVIVARMQGSNRVESSLQGRRQDGKGHPHKAIAGVLGKKCQGLEFKVVVSEMERRDSFQIY